MKSRLLFMKNYFCLFSLILVFIYSCSPSSMNTLGADPLKKLDNSLTQAFENQVKQNSITFGLDQQGKVSVYDKNSKIIGYAKHLQSDASPHLKNKNNQTIPNLFGVKATENCSMCGGVLDSWDVAGGIPGMVIANYIVEETGDVIYTVAFTGNTEILVHHEITWNCANYPAGTYHIKRVGIGIFDANFTGMIATVQVSEFCAGGGGPSPSPSPSVSNSPIPSPSTTATPSPTPSPTPVPTLNPTPTPSSTVSNSPSPEPSNEPGLDNDSLFCAENVSKNLEQVQTDLLSIQAEIFAISSNFSIQANWQDLIEGLDDDLAALGSLKISNDLRIQGIERAGRPKTDLQAVKKLQKKNDAQGKKLDKIEQTKNVKCASFTKLNSFEISKLQNGGIGAEALKKSVLGSNAKVAHYDLYKDAAGNIYVRPKGAPNSAGPGEPTNYNINNF